MSDARGYESVHAEPQPGSDPISQPVYANDPAAQNNSTTTNFGESEYGERMAYSSPKAKYNDLWAAILYVAHVAIILIVCLYLWGSKMDNVNNNTDGNTKSALKFGGIFATIILCLCAGTLFGVFWLSVIKRYASTIIKIMLFLNIGLWILAAVIGIITGNVGLIIVAIIVACFWSLYTWCIWGRIPFASALLAISAEIIQTYKATVWISIAVIVLNVLWIFLWFSTFLAYYVISDNNNDTNGGIVFLLLISFYWGMEVNRNISHTTTCGVAASWYFLPSGEIFNPTRGALQRTLTTSFGSVCFGSLIVAIIQAVKAMVRASANSKNGCCVCIALFILNCIENLIRWFNTYAYAHVAIYGSSFVEAGRATWNLFSSRGFEALINDDLSGMALMCGAFIGFLVSAAVGALGFAFYPDGDWYPTVPIILVVVGGFIGFVFCLCALMPVRSSIVTLFVCYAEDPATMFKNRPAEYQKVVNAKAEWANCYNQHGLQNV